MCYIRMMECHSVVKHWTAVHKLTALHNPFIAIERCHLVVQNWPAVNSLIALYHHNILIHKCIAWLRLMFLFLPWCDFFYKTAPMKKKMKKIKSFSLMYSKQNFRSLHYLIFHHSQKPVGKNSGKLSKNVMLSMLDLAIKQEMICENPGSIPVIFNLVSLGKCR